MQSKKLVEQIGLFRINRLLDLATERSLSGTKEDYRLSKRYINLATAISRHYKIKLPEEVKSRICAGCSAVLIPGISCSVRFSGGFVIYRCTACGNVRKLYMKRRNSIDRINAPPDG